jgi:redox-sensitive bicupin YhaK (pirin superfamily)
MKPAAYREIPPSEIPTAKLDGGGEVRVIAGTLQQSAGPVSGPIGGLSTEPMYFDVRLPADVDAAIPVPATHNAFMYVYEGDAVVGDDERPLPFRAAGLLATGDAVRIRAGGQGVKLLLLAGRPIGEPVVQYGPFVMNTPREIEQAIIDYQRGTLAAAG